MCALRFLFRELQVMAIRNLSPTPVLIGLPQILLASHLLQWLFYLLLVSLTPFHIAVFLVTESFPPRRHAFCARALFLL